METYQKRYQDVQTLEDERDELKEEVAGLKKKVAAMEQAMAKLPPAGEASTDIRQTYDDLITELKEFIAEGGVGVETRGEGVLITMRDRVLFKSGRTDLQKDGRAILTKVASVLSKTEGFYIRVGGHTDDVPISPVLRNRFPTNWELSALRASTVARFLIQKGAAPGSIILAAFSKYKPVADNSTAEGRRKNRRVEITLVRKDLYQ